MGEGVNLRYLVNISYDGSAFYGSQKQKDKRTVLGEIEKVLSKVLNKPIKVVGCSRTDKGVHANEFYFHVDSDKNIDMHSLNKMLPEDIIVNSVKVVSDDFHARYSVISKEYKYIINTGNIDIFRRNYVYNYSKSINYMLLMNTLKKFLGEKDFKTFTSDNEKESTVRNIFETRVERDGNLIIVYIRGNGFLKYMVRNIIGFALDVQEGKYKLEEVESIINSKDRTKIGKAAPGEGLYLNRVFY